MNRAPLYVSGHFPASAQFCNKRDLRLDDREIDDQRFLVGKPGYGDFSFKGAILGEAEAGLWKHERNSYLARKFGVDSAANYGAGDTRASISGVVSGRRFGGSIGGATCRCLLQPHERIVPHPKAPLFA